MLEEGEEGRSLSRGSRSRSRSLSDPRCEGGIGELLPLILEEPEAVGEGERNLAPGPGPGPAFRVGVILALL